MNPTRRHFSSLALGALASGAAVSGLSGCVSSYPGSPSASGHLVLNAGAIRREGEAQLRPGQAMAFRSINMYNGESTGDVLHRVAQANAQGIVIDLRNEQGLREERFARPWQVRQEAHHDATIRFERAVNLIPEQLTPGHEERQDTRYVVLRSGFEPDVFRNLFWHQRLEVIGHERITVPGGSFDTARILRRIFFQHFDVFRTQSSRTETLWYAPEVGYWVAREWSGQYVQPGGRRRSDVSREDWVRWELIRRMGPAES